MLGFFFLFFSFLKIDVYSRHRLDYYNEHILLHIESLTTTRPGVWLPTSCTLCAHERSPENDEPPKRYSNGNREIWLLCIEDNLHRNRTQSSASRSWICFNNHREISFFFFYVYKQLIGITKLLPCWIFKTRINARKGKMKCFFF